MAPPRSEPLLTVRAAVVLLKASLVCLMAGVLSYLGESNVSCGVAGGRKRCGRNGETGRRDPRTAVRHTPMAMAGCRRGRWCRSWPSRGGCAGVSGSGMAPKAISRVLGISINIWSRCWRSWRRTPSSTPRVKARELGLLEVRWRRTPQGRQRAAVMVAAAALAARFAVNARRSGRSPRRYRRGGRWARLGPLTPTCS